MAVKTQTIRFVMDVARAVRDLDMLNARLDKVRARSMGGAVRGGYGGSISGGVGSAIVGGEVAGLASKFSTLATATLSLYAAFRAVNSVIHTIAKAGVLVESSITQMTSFTGSGRNARSLIREAIRDSLTTPYTPSQQIGATMKATQFGMDPYAKGAAGLQNNRSAMDVINALGTFVDASGKMLGPERAIWAITQGNKRLLRPYGPDVLAAYERSYQTGGALGSGGQIKAFMVELSKMPKIFDLAINQSKTMQGLWSTITGFSDEFFIAFTGATEDPGVITFWSQIRDIMYDIKEAGILFFANSRDEITEVGTGIGGVLKWIWDMLNAIGTVLDPFIPVLQIIYQLVRIIAYVIGAVLNVALKVIEALMNLVLLPFRIASALVGCINKTDTLANNLMSFVAGLQATLQLFSIGLDGLVAEMKRPLDELVAGWSRVGQNLDILITKQISNLLYLKKAIYGVLNAVHLVSDESLAGATQDYMRSVAEVASKETDAGRGQGWYGELTEKGREGYSRLLREGKIGADGSYRKRGGGPIYDIKTFNYNFQPVHTPYMDPNDQTGRGVYR
jgi:hypothetical protein